MKAADISDVEVLRLIAPAQGIGISRWDLQEMLPQYPWKVVLAKLYALRRREFITGCACGCRGDFLLAPKGAEFLGRM